MPNPVNVSFKNRFFSNSDQKASPDQEIELEVISDDLSCVRHQPMISAYMNTLAMHSNWLEPTSRPIKTL